MRNMLPGMGTPRDYSANKPTVPGALTTLATIPAQDFRAGGYFVQNQSTADILVALDDGAGNDLTVITLGAAGVAGSQGGSTSADWGPHRGRIRVFGQAGAQVAVRAW